ncbi:hypothetical protein [Micromonospora ureilytica]|uniref:Uncharacterized protein n=1 Tax=Micromonospora ureilytica TaxID=709868 RepID=A0ABS0J9N4_9ACTN|nr:hypothetical protein [Micromonospora ureilytica]MBG6063762.1 hypothetical protein [Micromonospora ureilytica]
MNEPTEVRMPVRVRSWLGVAAATVIAAAAAAGFWWLAVPRFDVCAVVLPARAGCRSADRVSAATLGTAVVAVLYVATVVVALARPHRRQVLNNDRMVSRKETRSVAFCQWDG